MSNVHRLMADTSSVVNSPRLRAELAIAAEKAPSAVDILRKSPPFEKDTGGVVAMFQKFKAIRPPVIDALSTLVSKVPIAFDAADAVSALAPFRKWVDREFGLGTLLGDWVRVTSSNYSEAEREAALNRLVDHWFRNPLHPRRRPLVRVELRRRAAEHGTTVGEELKAATRQALPLAFAEVSDETLMDDFLRLCRARLSNLVMADLAGTEWRRKEDGKEIPLAANCDEPPDRLDLEYEAEVNEIGRALSSLVRELPARQRAAALARLEGRTLSNAEHQALFRLRKSQAWLRLVQDAS